MSWNIDIRLYSPLKSLQWSHFESKQLICFAQTSCFFLIFFIFALILLIFDLPILTSTDSTFHLLVELFNITISVELWFLDFRYLIWIPSELETDFRFESLLHRRTFLPIVILRANLKNFLFTLIESCHSSGNGTWLNLLSQPGSYLINFWVPNRIQHFKTHFNR